MSGKVPPSSHNDAPTMLGMVAIALKMLMGDPVKYFGLVFGIGFSTLLMSQQASIFVGLLTWGANPVLDVRQAQVWVMDPRVKQPDQGQPMSDQSLYRVRSVDGVAWAVPYARSTATVKTSQGNIAAITLVGVDNQSMVGLPEDNLANSMAAIRGRNAAILDANKINLIWADGRNPIGEVVEINDNRVVISGLTTALANFSGLPTLYMKYTDAIAITPPERNKLSFVLVGAKPGVEPEQLARHITEVTGLKALTRQQFAAAGTQFIVENTGIPISFGAAIGLGILVAVVITALTLAMFVAENLKNFGALKAIGVTNQQILLMVLSQALLVGFIGYGIGIGGTAAFLYFGQADPSLRGFKALGEIVFGSAVLVMLIVVGSAYVSVRKVLKLDPAVVFRG
ncbi:ABC transporter permease [Candidatus Phycosocius bacilliformis]|nr:ABC transporter permease [Candidatus Phycosocius bacilliformis]